MLALLSSLKEEQILNFRRLDLSKPAEDVKTEAAIIRVQMNTVVMILELPKYIKEAEELIKKREEKVVQMQQAQQASTLEEGSN